VTPAWSKIVFKIWTIRKYSLLCNTWSYTYPSRSFQTFVRCWPVLSFNMNGDMTAVDYPIHTTTSAYAISSLIVVAWLTHARRTYRWLSCCSSWTSPISRGTQHCDEHVCLYVCLYTGMQTSTNFQCILPVTVARTCRSRPCWNATYFRFCEWRQLLSYDGPYDADNASEN